MVYKSNLMLAPPGAVRALAEHFSRDATAQEAEVLVVDAFDEDLLRNSAADAACWCCADCRVRFGSWFCSVQRTAVGCRDVNSATLCGFTR